MATGNSFLVSAKDAVRMVAFNNGIRMAAAAADIDLTALRDSINALAKLDIKLEASRITITAKEEVVISRLYFDKGEIMPIIKRSSFGDTYWQQTGDPKDGK